MPDRIMLITHLGSLAMDAAQRGDDRAAETLREAIGMLMDDATSIKALGMRRENESSRKRKHRASRDGTAGNVPERDTPGFSPTPPFPTPLTTPSPPPREGDDANGVYARSCETYTELLRTKATSGEWEAIDTFVRRRGYATWKAWLSEMLKLTTGGKATLADLAQVCRDDAALERPIGSPQGLRGFLRSAADERVRASVPPTPAKPRIEHWTDKKVREEKESGERRLAADRSGNVDQRKQKPDGQRWWARMLSEAKVAGIHPILYAFDRMHQSGDDRAAS